MTRFKGFNTRRLFAVAGIEQPWPEPLPRDTALGFSIPLDVSVVMLATSKNLRGYLMTAWVDF